MWACFIAPLISDSPIRKVQVTAVNHALGHCLADKDIFLIHKMGLYVLIMIDSVILQRGTVDGMAGSQWFLT